MVCLCIVSNLNDLEFVSDLVKRVRPFFFEERLHIFVHRLGKRPLKNDLVAAFVGAVEVDVDLVELLGHVEGFEVDELVLYVPDCEESPN